MAKSKRNKKAEENGQEILEKDLAQEPSKKAKNESESQEVSAKSDLDQLKEEIEEHKDKYLRLYSEFDNFRKRTAREKLDLIKTATEDLIVSLLPVIDDFERATKAAAENRDQITKEGIDLIYQKFTKILEQKGVKAMDISPGDEFNDDIHEAITQIPAPEDKLKGRVIDVVERGYYLNEKVVRFAKVVTGA